MKTCATCGEKAVIRLSSGRGGSVIFACVAHVGEQLVRLLLDRNHVSAMVIKDKPKAGLG